MAFRISAKNLLVTWSQCPLPFEQALSLLVDKVGDQDAFRLAQEQHQDGNTHYHAFIRAATKFNITRNDHFDLIADGNTYHPNIQAARNAKASFEYVTKDGHYVDWNDPDPTGGSGSDWANALEQPDRESFMTVIRETNPRDYILQHERLEYFANQHYKQTQPEYAPRYLNFPNLPHTMQHWADNNLQADIDRPQSIILVGPSRLGKTEWARSLGKHMYWNGQFDLDLWDNDADYAIFDDWDWDRFYFWKQFLGAQKQFTLTDKYRKKRQVQWGKPCIILSNELPRFPDMTWVRENAIIVEIENRLY